ncbi:MAG: hypothetical protein M3R24_37410 [Chloroflexota bacterium]|nr:hypothetical protein [Chloroflexota bacterium]
MFDLLLLPAAPFYVLSVAGTLVAVLGLLQLEQTRTALLGVRTLPSRRGVSGRFVLGQAAALPLVAVLLLTAYATSAAGTDLYLLGGSALVLWLYVGLVLPRKPLVQAQRERRRLRQLTPGFVAYVRVALAGYDAPMTLLERYIRRADRRKAVMQVVVAEALGLMEDRRLMPFEALRVVARARGCQELVDVAESLAQTEREGVDPQRALQAHEVTLLAVLEDEFKRLLKKRTMYLLLLVALSVVVGILGNLLWTMVGSAILMGTV